jgi:hypothetical protein
MYSTSFFRVMKDSDFMWQKQLGELEVAVELLNTFVEVRPEVCEP